MATTNQDVKSKENWRVAMRFIRWQAGLLTFCAVVYVLLHYFIPASKTFPKPSQLIQLNAFGLATVVSAEDMDWYIGSDKSIPLLTQMNERNKNIQTRLGNMRQQLQELAAQFSEEAATPIRNAVDLGHFDEAAHEIAGHYSDLAPGTIKDGSDRLINQTEETLRELSELQREQQESLTLFGPPEKFKLFWVSPWGIIFEVTAWSLFGLFASLLFHSARYARKGKFKESETAVGWTKLFYTPVVAVVLVLAIADGLLHVGSIGTRIWLIPLFGFLAGFNSRKAARLVDALSNWVLGRMARSLEGDAPASATATNTGIADIRNALTPPETFDDIGTQAKIVADAMLATKLSQLPKS